MLGKIKMAIQMLILFILLSSCAARVLQRDDGVVRVALSRHFQANNSNHEKRQHEASLPQVGAEIYFIQGILCHWYLIIGVSSPDTS
jgi:hypothetical protein